jgi:hypothetical protein
VRVALYGWKFATTVFALVIVTVQVMPDTESHPVHPPKSDKTSGCAVSVTTVIVL